MCHQQGNFEVKGENSACQQFFFSPPHRKIPLFNPLPDVSILSSSSSTANKDMKSKIWTNGDTII